MRYHTQFGYVSEILRFSCSSFTLTLCENDVCYLESSVTRI